MHTNSFSSKNEIFQENQDFLTQQLLTYIGNKRSLLNFIGDGLQIVKKRLQKDTLSIFDVFSGSGIVSRYFKQHASNLYTNDLEKYATYINECYLTNQNDLNYSEFNKIHAQFCSQLTDENLKSGFIAEMYAPKDDNCIKNAERVFYTTRNAKYIDTARQLIENVPQQYRKFLLAPLLTQASVHANTSGVFKGFYKNSETGIGHFGGKKQDALKRIKGTISIPVPIFSNFECAVHVFNGDSNVICEQIPEIDLAYLDPPYNQHPYGSNYFMLNLILDYKKPDNISAVSGIPSNWNRSNYNKSASILGNLSDLIQKIKAKYLLVSFNSDGFISLDEMKMLLSRYGKTEILETQYNTFKGSRNLYKRTMHVTEYLYLLEKS